MAEHARALAHVVLLPRRPVAACRLSYGVDFGLVGVFEADGSERGRRTLMLLPTLPSLV
jgi:hypothetical protein